MLFLDFRTRDVGGPVASTPAVYDGSRRIGWGLGALPPHPGGICFVVHGFNNSRSAGTDRIDGFTREALRAVPGLQAMQMVGVLWPGDAIFGFLSYPTEEADADRTAAGFSAELERVRLATPPHFVAHSLGCRVVLQTLDTLARRQPKSRWAEEVILFAGAVDDDVLGRTDRYARGARNARRVVNVASTSDRVLQFAFPAGDWIAGIFSSGYTRRALGRGGPASQPAAPQGSCSIQVGGLGVGHGDYLGGDSALRKRASVFAGAVVQTSCVGQY